MGATIIDGKAFAEGLRSRVATAAARLTAEGLTPGLAVVLVGEDPASQVYVRMKERRTREAGLASTAHRLPPDTSEAELLALVQRLNADPLVHGILVQLPLPDQIDSARILEAIDPAKDVDGFHPVNRGRLVAGVPALVPCTPLGCLMLLQDHLGDLSGATAVVLGRSNIVGKPMAQLLTNASATVTVAHSRSRDLPAIARGADILVSAIGRPGIVTADWVAPGATVIDVGINRTEDGLVGDVAPEVWEVAGAMTPVPGGVGPMTIACLLANAVTAACRIHDRAPPPGLSG